MWRLPMRLSRLSAQGCIMSGLYTTPGLENLSEPSELSTLATLPAPAEIYLRFNDVTNIH